MVLKRTFVSWKRKLQPSSPTSTTSLCIPRFFILYISRGKSLTLFVSQLNFTGFIKIVKACDLHTLCRTECLTNYLFFHSCRNTTFVSHHTSPYYHNNTILFQKNTKRSLKPTFIRDYLDKRPFYKFNVRHSALPKHTCHDGYTFAVRRHHCQIVQALRLGSHKRTSSRRRRQRRRVTERVRPSNDQILGQYTT